MTLYATRDEQSITIHGNIHLDVKVANGSVTEFAVTEDAAHVRSLWSSLGRLLDEAEHPDPEA